GQTDLAPTLLCLLGIDAAPLPYVGRNLLSPEATGPVPRPYGEWIDDGHLFLSRRAGGECRDPSGPLIARDQCVAADRLARRDREVARLVVTADLQTRLRELMTR